MLRKKDSTHTPDPMGPLKAQQGLSYFWAATWSCREERMGQSHRTAQETVPLDPPQKGGKCAPFMGLKIPAASKGILRDGRC